jgi:hypothetical protein
MQPQGDAHQFYVIMTHEDDQGGWEALELFSEGSSLVLFFLAQSAGSLSESGPEQGTDEKK